MNENQLPENIEEFLVESRQSFCPEKGERLFLVIPKSLQKDIRRIRMAITAAIVQRLPKTEDYQQTFSKMEIHDGLSVFRLREDATREQAEEFAQRCRKNTLLLLTGKKSSDQATQGERQKRDGDTQAQ